MKKSIIAIAICFSMMLSIHALSSVSDGDAAMKDENYRVAINEYKDAIEANPEDMELLAKLARAYNEGGWYWRAAVTWEEYIEKYPEGKAAEEAKEQASKARRWIGVQYYQSGAPVESAIEQLETSIKIYPQNIDAHYWLARIYFEDGSFDDCIKVLQNATEIDSDNAKVKWLMNEAAGAKEYGGEAYSIYSQAYSKYEAGELEEALQMYQKSSESNPEFIGARIWIARVLLEMEKFDEAVAAWDKVLELDPENKRAKWFKSVAKSKIQQ